MKKMIWKMSFPSFSFKENTLLKFGLALALIFSFNAVFAATYYSKGAATNFNDVNSWGSATDGTGTSPASLSDADDFIIQNGSILNLTGNATVRSLTINAGKIIIASNVLTVAIPSANNTQVLVASGGTMEVTGGSIEVMGAIYFADGSGLTQSGGLIKVDGNSGTNTTSVGGASGTSVIFGIGYGNASAASSISTVANGAKFVVTGGTIQIVDPSLSTASSYSFAYQAGVGVHLSFGTGHTVKFGDGVSTQAAGNVNGFYVYNWVGNGYLSWGNVEVDVLTGTNRIVKTNSSIGILGNLNIVSGEYQNSPTSYIAGNITNNGTLTSSGTWYFGTWTNGVASAALNGQTVSGTGVFRNSATTITANYLSLTFNNSSASGVTFQTAQSLLSGSNTGTVSSTLNFTNGIVNIGANTFILGTTVTSLGTLTYTAGGFVSGSTFSRWVGTAGSGTTISASLSPNPSTGSFPFVSGNPVTGMLARHFHKSTAALTTGGRISVQMNDGIGTTAIGSPVTETQVYDRKSNVNWVVSRVGAVGSATATYCAVATGAFNIATANVKLLKDELLVNTAQNGSNVPMGQRTALSYANQIGVFTLGAPSAEIPNGTIASGKWENPTIWESGIVPSCSDNISINGGHTVQIDATTGTANVKSILLSPNSNLEVLAGVLTIGCTNKNNYLVNNGTLTVSGGIVNINGNWSNSTGSSIYQTGGVINIDGNDGGAPATSVASGTPLFSIGASGANWTTTGGYDISLTGGEICIVDPHTATISTDGLAMRSHIVSGQARFALEAHTIKFGNGVSTDAGGHTSGFLNSLQNSASLNFGTVIVNNPSGTNRVVTQSGGPQPASGNFTIESGEYNQSTFATGFTKDLVVKSGGIFTAGGTATFARYSGTTPLADTIAQTVSVQGSGIIRNNATSPTANFTNVTIFNGAGVGPGVEGLVTFTSLNAIAGQPASSASASGTTTFTAGKASTASGVTYVIGIPLTSAGTLTLTAGGFISGSTVARSWTSANTGTTLTAGIDPTTSTSRYPFITASGLGRSAWIQRTSPTVGGALGITYTESAGTSPTFLVEQATGYEVDLISNDNWSVSALGTAITSGSYSLSIVAPGVLQSLVGADSTRLVQSAGIVGSHLRGTITPTGQRSGLSLADLTSDAFYIGINNNELPNIAQGTIWQDISSWSKGYIPTCTDVVVIPSGVSMVSVASANVCSKLTIQTGGTLTLNGGDLTVGCSNNNSQLLIAGGTLNVQAGILIVNGQFALNAVASGVFSQTGGNIFVDGNSGTLATSYPGHIVDLYCHTASTLQLTGGNFTVVNPTLSATTTFASFKVYPSVAASSGPAWNLFLGNGVSTLAGGHSGGFLLNLVNSNTFRIDGTVTVNTQPGTNRHVSTSGNIALTNLLITLGEYRVTSSNYISGNLTNNGTLTSTSTVFLGDFSGTTASASAFPQNISGSGVFQNLSTSPTANFTSLTINNSHATGVTLNVPVSVSGTLTLTSGITNTTATNYLKSGTTAAAGTLSGTPSATNFINGPYLRTFAASRTTSGTYSNVTLFPVGKLGNYRPIYIDPITSASGAVEFTAEAFLINSGTPGSGVTNLSNTNWSALPTSGAANLTSSYIRILDAGTTTTSKLVQATGPTAAYEGLTVGTVSAGIGGFVTTSSPIVAVDYSGYFAYGDLDPCTTPIDQATALTPSLITTTTFTGTISPATSNPTGYLVVRYPSAGTPTAPADLTVYAAGANLGGTVVGNYASAPFQFNVTGLTASTTYDFYVYAYNNSSCAGPSYNTVNPLMLSVTTCAAVIGAPGTPVASLNTTNSFTATWTASSTAGVDYILDVATNSTFTAPVAGFSNLNVGTGVLTQAITGLNAATNYYVRVRAISGTCVSAISSTLTTATACNAILAPWTDGLESFNTTTNSTIPGSSCWTSSPSGSSSVYRWDVSSAGTPSSLTGPLAPATGARYAYSEASSGVLNAEAYLLSPFIDLSALANPALYFDYHMNGSTMGTLRVDINNGTGWVNGIATFIGQQQTSQSDPWINHFTSLASYVGQTVQLRFTTIRGSDFYGDMAIDNISIIQEPSCTGTIGGTVTTPVSIACGPNNSTTLTNSGYSLGLGTTYQWQKSNDNFATNIVNISGETNPASAATGTFSSGINYYRLLVSCTPTSSIGYSNVVSITYSNPTLVSTTPGAICGTGTVALVATAAGGDNIRWYNQAVGGTIQGTGVTFTTPTISSTTNYFAAAVTPTPGSLVSQGAGATTSATYSNPFYSLYSNIHTQHVITAAELTASGLFAGNISSVALDVTVAGTLPMIDLEVKIGTTANATAAAFETGTLSTVFSSASFMPTVGVNTMVFSTPFNWDGTSNIVLDFCHGNPSSTATMSRTVRTDATPYVSTIKTHSTTATAGSAACSNITSALLTYSVRPVFIFEGVGACEGIRDTVVATVTTPPALTLSSAAEVICAGSSSSAVNVTSTILDFDSYVWSPASGVTGTTSATFNPIINTVYTLTAVNSTTGCTNIATETITVNAIPSISASASTNPICAGLTETLTAVSISTIPYAMNSAGTETFVDISTTGVSVGTISDDSEHNITMPSFTFNGIAYTTARVGTNGAIALGSTTGEISFSNALIPNSIHSAGNVILAPFNDDLDVNLSGTIMTQTIGNKFIVQYHNIDHNAFTTGSVRFQIQMDNSNGQVHFVYDDVVFGSVTYDNGASAAVGIQWSAAGGITYSNNTASLANGQCITFAPISNPLSWTGPNSYSSSTAISTISNIAPINAGIYTATATGSNGCTNSASVTLVVNQSTNATQTVTAPAPYVWPVNSVSYSTSGLYTATIPNTAGCDSVITLDLTIQAATATLNVTAFIEGYYIPASSPAEMVAAIYTNDQFGGLGTLPSNSVDSVTVELVDISYVTQFTSNGMLTTNGSLSVSFDAAAIGGSYYIKLNHKNTLNVWSSSMVTIAPSNTYNFSTSLSSAATDGSSAPMATLATGLYGLYSGDINKDGFIDANDYLNFTLDETSSAFGSFFLPSDLQGDGFVDAFDYPIFSVNSANGVYEQYP